MKNLPTIEEILKAYVGIKSKERLPDTSREVYVRSNHGYIQHCYYRFNNNIWEWQNKSNGVWHAVGNNKNDLIKEWSEITLTPKNT